MNYRKLWIKNFGEIPKDNRGVKYDIHHIDGNRKNNNIENLLCVSVEEHYLIHKSQYEIDGNYKDLASCKFLLARLGKSLSQISGYNIPEDVKDKIRRKLIGVKHSCERIKNRKNTKGYKWSKEAIDSRRNGLLKYYENVSDEKLKVKSDKISKAHKGKIVREDTKEKLSRFNSKLTDKQVLEIDNLILSGVKYNIISDKYNISPAQITAIKQRKTYKWIWN